MEVELLVIAECPGAEEASALLRPARDDIGLPGMRFTVSVVDADEKARTPGLAGSPAFLVGGVDLFASDQSEGSMACRVSSTPEGPRNMPGLRDLRKALNEHAAPTARV